MQAMAFVILDYNSFLAKVKNCTKLDHKINSEKAPYPFAISLG